MMRLLIPLVVFGGLVALLVAGLQTADQRQVVESPLVGKPVPEFTLPRLHLPDETLSTAELQGEPWILNVWGSWCPSCRDEHPFIERLGREAGIRLVGFNWKDERENAFAWLDRYGDAWHMHFHDYEGRAAIDLGVYGAPETFLIDHTGTIRHKHIGPVDAVVYEDLMQRIMELRAQTSSTDSGMP